MAHDDSPPPNLLIDEDDDDDGYPNTPPVLERQDYYMENDDHEPEPAPVVVVAPPIPNQWFIFRSEFYLSERLQRINPSLYVAHSPTFLLDLICILCQRVCNEAYAAPCYANHRFCRDCILARFAVAKWCPRCGDYMKTEPRPDPTYDRIIETLRYNTKKVNYVDLNPEERQDLTDTDSEEEIKSKSLSPEREIRPASQKTAGDLRVEFEKKVRRVFRQQRRRKKRRAEAEKRGINFQDNHGKIVRDEQPPPYKYILEHKKREDPNFKPKTMLNLKGIEGSSYAIQPEWKTLETIPHYAYVEPRWFIGNLKKPLQNMVYKTFWFNQDIKWPDNTPPPPPFGLTLAKLRSLKLANKARKKIWNDKFLSKREKKVLIHIFLTKDLEVPYDIPPFLSSDDDDDPPPLFTPARFEYPPEYRKPRKDWRRLFDEEGNRLEQIPEHNKKTPSTNAKRKMKLLWKRWGEPTLLLREASTKSSIPFIDLTRVYLGVRDNVTIGHLRNYIYRRIGILKNMKMEFVKKRYLVEFYDCVAAAKGQQVEVIKCNEIKKKKQPIMNTQSAMLQPSASKVSAPPVLTPISPPTPASTVQQPIIAAKFPVKTLPLHPIKQMSIKQSMKHQSNKQQPNKSTKQQIAKQVEQNLIDIRKKIAPQPQKELTVRDIALKNLETQGLISRTLNPIPSTLSTGAPNDFTYTARPLFGKGCKYTPRGIYKPRSRPVHGNIAPRSEGERRGRPSAISAIVKQIQANNAQAQVQSSALAQPQAQTQVQAQALPQTRTQSTIGITAKATPSTKPSVTITSTTPSVAIAPNLSVPVRDYIKANLTVQQKLVLQSAPQKCPLGASIMEAPIRTVPYNQQSNRNASIAFLGPSTSSAGRNTTLANFSKTPFNPKYRMSAIRSAPLPAMPQSRMMPSHGLSVNGQSSSMPNGNIDPNIMLVQCVNPQTKEIQYMQLTNDGKIVPIQSVNGVLVTSPKNAANGTAPNGIPEFSQALKKPQAAVTRNIQTRGIGTGQKLKKNQQAYFMKYPLSALNTHLKVNDLRRPKNLRKGERCVLFYSIRDIKKEEILDPPPMHYPPTVRQVRKMLEESDYETDYGDIIEVTHTMNAKYNIKKEEDVIKMDES